MKHWEKLDLKTSSIFDLTDDKELISSILGFNNTKEKFLAGCTEIGRILTMLDFAEETKDEALKKKLRTTFKEELAPFFNERFLTLL